MLFLLLNMRFITHRSFIADVLKFRIVLNYFLKWTKITKINDGEKFHDQQMPISVATMNWITRKISEAKQIREKKTDLTFSIDGSLKNSTHLDFEMEVFSFVFLCHRPNRRCVKKFQNLTREKQKKNFMEHWRCWP